MRHVRAPEDHVIVVFGANGDLARRKLLPALYHLNGRRAHARALRNHRKLSERNERRARRLGIPRSLSLAPFRYMNVVSKSDDGTRTPHGHA
jgi:hypothetical protein